MKRLIFLMFTLSMVLAVSAKPLSTKLESAISTESMAVAGSDNGNIGSGFWWTKNYNVNGGWGHCL
jgi:hypothetical protein